MIISASDPVGSVCTGLNVNVGVSPSSPLGHCGDSEESKAYVNSHLVGVITCSSLNCHHLSILVE